MVRIRLLREKGSLNSKASSINIKMQNVELKSCRMYAGINVTAVFQTEMRSNVLSVWLKRKNIKGRVRLKISECF